jgi:LysR substrate binding domain
LRKWRPTRCWGPVHDRRVDLGLLYRPLADPDLSQRLISTEHLLLALSDAHPAAHAAAIALHGVREESFVPRAAPSGSPHREGSGSVPSVVHVARIQISRRARGQRPPRSREPAVAPVAGWTRTRLWPWPCRRPTTAGPRRASRPCGPLSETVTLARSTATHTADRHTEAAGLVSSGAAGIGGGRGGRRGLPRGGAASRAVSREAQLPAHLRRGADRCHR